MRQQQFFYYLLLFLDSESMVGTSVVGSIASAQSELSYSPYLRALGGGQLVVGYPKTAPKISPKSRYPLHHKVKFLSKHAYSLADSTSAIPRRYLHDTCHYTSVPMERIIAVTLLRDYVAGQGLYGGICQKKWLLFRTRKRSCAGPMANPCLGAELTSRNGAVDCPSLIYAFLTASKPSYLTY